MSEEMIPIIMFISIAVVLCVLFWFRYKGRSDMQVTFRAALERGQELTPEVIDRLGHPKPSKDKDLRFGIMWLALAVGLVLVGVAVQEPDAIRGTMAGAAFPLCIGIAYLILHKFTGRD